MDRKIVEDWDGPVCIDDRFFDDLDEAVEYYWDDCYNGKEPNISEVPEFAECCDPKFPTHDASDWIVEHIDENNPVSDDSTSFSDHVSSEQIKELSKLVDGWIKSVDWQYYQRNNKFIALRPLVEAYEKQVQHRNGLLEWMDYAGT
jgi:hypothetical protein